MSKVLKLLTDPLSGFKVRLIDGIVGDASLLAIVTTETNIYH